MLREAAVSRPIWESRGALDGSTGQDSSLERFVRDRSGQSLAHVFTLLSLVLNREPLQIAFRSLHADDPRLRGTALEYLEEVLPVAIRQQLWPFLTGRGGAPAPGRSREGMAARLRHANPSPTLIDILNRAEKPHIAGFSPA